MQGKVEICGINTAKLEVLKNDEMTELLRRTKEGDMAAREKLIRGNLRLVLSVLQRFASRGENMDDLFQVGCIGLIKAVDNFDINQPVRFSTYGVPMIVGEIRRYLRDNSAIRVSRSLRDTAYKVLQARERLLRQSQREPTVEQLAQELDTRVIERTRALTEETEARKSMMLNIFHDLRSPLFAVSNGLDTLAEAPDALPTLLPALQQRVAFVRSLTEDLFLAAKLEQKQVLLNEDRVALNEATAAVCAACQSEAAQKGVTLRAETDCFLPVWGDNVRLQQVVQNLVTNAIHYTPAGGVVTVTCAREGGTARVTVQDTGCGIAPEDQAAVFDRYFHTAANTKHDSTGLGLTIAQELAHLHHGEITLQSEVGKGSRFTLKLPILE